MKSFVFIFLLFIIFAGQITAQNWDKVYGEVNGMHVAMKDNKYGFLDASKKTVVPAIYEDAFDFQKIGYAVVQKNGKRGCIDKTGKIVIPIIYDKVYSFKDGKATIILNNKKGKITPSGTITWGLAIGDYVQGGIIIQLDKTGEHGVVCAIKDCGGHGKKMEESELDVCTHALFRKNGQKRWRVPSYEELGLMQEHYKLINEISRANKGQEFGGYYYWSSTASSKGFLYPCIGGLDGVFGMSRKVVHISEKHSLRAVHDF